MAKKSMILSLLFCLLAGSLFFDVAHISYEHGRNSTSSVTCVCMENGKCTCLVCYCGDDAGDVPLLFANGVLNAFVGEDFVPGEIADDCKQKHKSAKCEVCNLFIRGRNVLDDVSSRSMSYEDLLSVNTGCLDLCDFSGISFSPINLKTRLNN